MKHFLSFVLFSFSIFLASCVNVMPITKGRLSENETFDFIYYNYTEVHKKGEKLFNNCKVFIIDFKDSQKKTIEKFFWYSCGTLMPLKFFYTYDNEYYRVKTNFLIADTTENPLIPLSEIEEKALGIMNKYLAGKGYQTFSINGFSYLSAKDSLASLPFLTRTILATKHGR